MMLSSSYIKRSLASFVLGISVISSGMIPANAGEDPTLFFQANPPVGGLVGGNIVTGGPSAYAHSHLFNGPWNFTPPQLLFHPSKTINDQSIFRDCRIINTEAKLRSGLSGIKDYFFGIYDEREYVNSAKVTSRGVSSTDGVIACGLNTNLPPTCVTFMGSGYVFMEEYASEEAALVALSRMAARKGANVIGNVNCTYSENLRNTSTNVGANVGYGAGFDTSGSDSHLIGTGVGLGVSSGRARRPAQPHCTGDFYTAQMSGCQVQQVAAAPAQPPINLNFYPPSVPYRRYLPPSPEPEVKKPVRGLW